MTFAILVTGAREWTDVKTVKNVLRKYKDKDCVLIHGDCDGLDKIAGMVGKKLGFDVRSFPANWEKYGRAAGPIRNKEMINELLKYESRVMFAFHDCIEQSRGTKNCVTQAKKLGIECEIFHSYW
jgi:hypothetical protein